MGRESVDPEPFDDNARVEAMIALELGRISGVLLANGWQLHCARPAEHRLELIDTLAFPDAVFVLEVS